MDIKDIEKLKKIADANNDIQKINDLLNDMSQFNKKANSVFDKIDKNSDYKKYVMLFFISDNSSIDNSVLYAVIASRNI